MTAFAQAAERALNSVPEGLLIAALAWIVARLIGRTPAARFVIWLVALLAIVVLPFMSVSRRRIGLAVAARVEPAGFVGPCHLLSVGGDGVLRNHPADRGPVEPSPAA